MCSPAPSAPPQNNQAIASRAADPYLLSSFGACSAEAHGKNKKNCANNPLCVWGLGERHQNQGLWAEATAKKGDFAARRLGTDPSESIRSDVSRPAGIHNLGATCYLNSLMQCLFHLPGFRSGVCVFSPPASSRARPLTASSPLRARSYAWKRSAVEGAAVDVSAFERIMDVMQKTFCTMEFSNQATASLDELVEVLGLQSGVQQGEPALAPSSSFSRFRTPALTQHTHTHTCTHPQTRKSSTSSSWPSSRRG